MEQGTLPFPPGELAPVAPPHQSSAGTTGASAEGASAPVNLLEKYKISANDGASAAASAAVDSATSATSSGWGASKEERMSNLDKKRQEMILRARQRLANQLQAKPI